MNESTANQKSHPELYGAMQFSLRSLLHLCCFASAGSLAIRGAISGKSGAILVPSAAIGVCYTIIVAYRLRKTIARFPWDLANFFFSWLFLVAYVALVVTYLHSLKEQSFRAMSLVRGITIGLSPIALWAAYRIARIYWRAKYEPEDDYA
jgi:hypothetical protein